MTGQFAWWHWVEHVLAIGGLAWLANALIEALSQAVERKRVNTHLERDIQQVLMRVWRQEHDSLRKVSSSPLLALPPMPFGRHLAETPLSDTERLKRQVKLALWGGAVTWQLSRHAKHQQELLDLYTRASRDCIQAATGVTLVELDRITASAARGQTRPTEFSKGLLYDLAAIYFEARRVHEADLAAAAVVPMLLEEYVKTPDAGADELLARWQARSAGKLEEYRPAT